METHNEPSKDKDEGETTPERVADELRQMVDEIRVKLHLGKMEAKDAWKRVEPDVRAALGKIRSAVEGLVTRRGEDEENVAGVKDEEASKKA